MDGRRRTPPVLWALVGLAVLGAVLYGLRGPLESEPMPVSVSVRTSPPVPPPASAPALPEHVTLSDQSVAAIERALVAGEVAQRETAFDVVLPELIANDPNAAVALLARQPPGEARDALRDQIARRWVRRDRAATTAWLHSLEDEAERRDAATVAVRALAAGSVPDAVDLADEFGIGRQDGTIDHMLQVWALDPEQAHPYQKPPTRDVAVSN